MNWDLIIKLAVGALGLATATVVALKQINEFRARKSGLSANPKRCLEHEERMGKMEVLASSVASSAAARLDGISKQLDGVSDDVKYLIRIHIKE